MPILCFEDHSEEVDKMTKIITRYGKLYKCLKRLNCFLKVLNPTKPVAIDEVIVLFKGKVIFKQHILRKHKKFIIKIYELCDTLMT